MDAFAFAMKMETEGILMYEKILSKTTNPGLRSILQMLIGQEKQHYHLFEYMKDSADADMKKVSFKGIKTMFEKMREKGEKLPDDQVKMYKRIQKVEEDSEKTYKEIAEKVDDEGVKQQILTIADEEHRHAEIMHNIIEMITRPDFWIEDAEFVHLEEY
ncbi:ferritin family protein [Candidatus Woesearchaeota archaeon]|nr:ferritin family protein [Candidatus Woesearchaeota archaeon]